MAIIGISGKINSGKDTVGSIIQYLMSEDNRKETGHDISYEDFVNKSWNEKELSGWEIKKFAGKLKDIVCLLIGCTREQLEDQDFKNKELGEEWTKWHLEWDAYETYDDRYFVTETEAKAFEPEYIFKKSTAFDGKDREVTRIVLTPRLILQLLGTEAGRNIIHPNIWVNALMANYKYMTTRRMDIMDLKDGSVQRGRDFEVEDDYLGIYPKWLITDMRFPNEMAAIKSRDGITIRVNTNRAGELSNHASEISLDDAEFDYTIDNSGTIEELIEKVQEIMIDAKLIKHKIEDKD